MLIKKETLSCQRPLQGKPRDSCEQADHKSLTSPFKWLQSSEGELLSQTRSDKHQVSEGQMVKHKNNIDRPAF